MRSKPAAGADPFDKIKLEDLRRNGTGPSAPTLLQTPNDESARLPSCGLGGLVDLRGLIFCAQRVFDER